jgi:hypothetical protein
LGKKEEKVYLGINLNKKTKDLLKTRGTLLKEIRKNMDWRHGSNGRAPALQARSPEFIL